jgi:glycosyltransferase involved in cell wall biosynthesis
MELEHTITPPACGAREQPRPGAHLRISVLICAHTMERWRELEAGVASVLDQTHPAHEVIVTIDHDELLLDRARAEFPEVRVLASEGAPGVAGARNTALRYATGDVVGFIDDDARADHRWLEAIARAHADPRVLGTCGTIEPRWEGPPPAWMPPELYWVVGCSYRGLPTTVAPLRRAIGANMSFVRDAFDEVGAFDEELGRLRHVPASCEDTEFAIRALRERPGTQLLHLPDARVQHAVPRARTTWRYLVWRCWTEGRAKQLLTRAVGPGAGLADERAYVIRVLPAGFAAGLRDSLRGDPDGLRRAGAIVAALGLTVAGYLYGLAAGRPPSREGWR